MIDANTDAETAYAGPDAADADDIKYIVLLVSIESLLNTALYFISPLPNEPDVSPLTYPLAEASYKFINFSGVE